MAKRRPGRPRAKTWRQGPRKMSDAAVKRYMSRGIASAHSASAKRKSKGKKTATGRKTRSHSASHIAAIRKGMIASWKNGAMAKYRRKGTASKRRRSTRGRKRG